MPPQHKCRWGARPSAVNLLLTASCTGALAIVLVHKASLRTPGKGYTPLKMQLVKNRFAVKGFLEVVWANGSEKEAEVPILSATLFGTKDEKTSCCFQGGSQAKPTGNSKIQRNWSERRVPMHNGLPSLFAWCPRQIRGVPRRFRAGVS